MLIAMKTAATAIVRKMVTSSVLPSIACESIAYLALCGLVYESPVYCGAHSHLCGLLFVCAISGTTLFSAFRHAAVCKNYSGLLLLNSFIHGVVGVWVLSSSICFLAVLLLLAGLGLLNGLYSPRLGIRFILSSLISSALVTTVASSYLVLSRNCCSSPALGLFIPGALYLGPSVLYLSLLILSSPFYTDRRLLVRMNIAVLSCVAAGVYHAEIFDLHGVSGLAGTFFILYFLDKGAYLLPYNPTAWAWSTLAVGIVVYLVSHHGVTHLRATGLDKYFFLLPPLQNTPLP